MQAPLLGWTRRLDHEQPAVRFVAPHQAGAGERFAEAQQVDLTGDRRRDLEGAHVRGSLGPRSACSIRSLTLK